MIIELGPLRKKLDLEHILSLSRVVFSMGCGPRCQTISSDLMTNNRISIENGTLSVFTFSTLIQIYQLILGNKKIRHIVASERSIIYCWVFGQ